MTISLPRISFPAGWPADPLDRRIALARLSVGIERLLPALWPALGFAGLYLAAGLCGLFRHIPWEAQALLLAGAVTATALALLKGFDHFAWASDFEGARRLERDSGLAHRPISERDDVLPDGADPVTAALWAAHRARMAKTARLRLALPAADFTTRDPKGLRWYLVILLALGIFLARDDFADRLSGLFISDSNAGIDAWIDPPAYTGLPLRPVTAEDGAIAVPIGSVLNLRVHGAPHAPGFTTGVNARSAFSGSGGDYAATTRIAHDGRVRVRVAGHELADWRVTVIPDSAPRIAFVGVPQRTEQLAMAFHYKASDDYGVTQVAVIVAPRNRPGAPSIRVPLDGGGGKNFETTSFADLTSNAYAGLPVEAWIEARDGAGNRTLSAPVSFTLPARVFTDPLARALIEQRQNLAAAPNAGARRHVADMLAALTIAPEQFFEDKRSAYLAIRAARWSILGAKVQGDLNHASDLLWDTAIALERGGLLNAAEELRRIQALLNQAMASGAPQDQIEQLLQRYNQAMQRYMEALAANPPPPGSEPQAGENAVTMSQDDIQKLMDMIKQLSEAGQREQAAQMLAMLQNLLENMRMTQGQNGQGQGQEGNKALNDAMNKLGETMGQQRGLLDKTFREGQGQGNPRDGGAKGLAQQQQKLEQQLGEARKGVDPKLTGKMDDAARAMQQSRDALQKGDLDGARQAQQQALQSMSQAQQQLAEQARRESGRPAADRSDPFGRNTNTGNQVKIPDASALARARAILEELRRRAGEMGRPQEERDYIDRLLKSF
jgi:uncharacterized protein (TIGR02302 family)